MIDPFLSPFINHISFHPINRRLFPASRPVKSWWVRATQSPTLRHILFNRPSNKDSPLNSPIILNRLRSSSPVLVVQINNLRKNSGGPITELKSVLRYHTLRPSIIPEHPWCRCREFQVRCNIQRVK